MEITGVGETIPWKGGGSCDPGLRESHLWKQPGVWNSPGQHYPSLVLLWPRDPSMWSLPTSLLTNPQASACLGNRKAAKSFNSWGQSWSRITGSCRDPQLSASECLTQTHGWPEGSLHTCQGYVAGLLRPIWEDFWSSNLLSLGPDKKQWEQGRRNYC